MARVLSWLGSVFILLILAACAESPAVEGPLEFETDSRILRGVWEGTSDSGELLRLEVRASDPTAEGYRVTGTFSLGSGIAGVVAFSGGVRVPLEQAPDGLSAQVSPVCEGTFFATSPDAVWELCGDAPTGAPPSLPVSLINQSVDGGVTELAALTKIQDEQSMTGTLVSGTINHTKGVPYTHPGDFVFTEDSHAVVQLWYSWSALGDAPGELVAETRLEGITSFPLSYRIEGDLQKVFLREGDYFLHVDVYSGAEDESKVGDLINEWFTPVPSPGAIVDVEVIGLESCDSPDVGGVCTSP